MISVIVCTYNRAHILATALESFEQLRRPAGLAWELIVVDNNSGDDTEQVVKSYRDHAPFEVRYVFEPRQGLSHARNRGVVESKYPILAFTDDDVRVSPDWLEQLADTYTRFDCVGVGGRIVAAWSSARPEWLRDDSPYPLMKAIVSFDQGEEPCLLSTPPYGANMSFRRAAFEENGLFRIDLGRNGAGLLAAEDTEFGARLLRKNARLMYNPAVVVYHPVGPERTTRRYFQRWYFDYGRTSLRLAAVPPRPRDHLGRGAGLLRSVAACLLGLARARDGQQRFHVWLQLCHELGRIREALRGFGTQDDRRIPQLERPQSEAARGDVTRRMAATFQPVKVIDVDVGGPVVDIERLNGYGSLQALVKVRGTPIGYVTVPVSAGRCTASVLTSAIDKQYDAKILAGREAHDTNTPALDGSRPIVTVAVCTRDREGHLAVCLESLRRLNYEHLEILVVDNAPADDRAERLVRATLPAARYVVEPRPGLNWARNRAAREARGEIIAYTDDDVVVDPGWVTALASVFACHPDVMAVTGLVVPYELETAPQVLFEQRGGFGRGFQRKWYRREKAGTRELSHLRAWEFGTGANMAFRRRLLDRLGGFDPALDVGTVSHGGGDLDMFFRVVQEGHTLVYEPSAIVRHRHRRDYGALRRQMRDNGIGFYAYLIRNAVAYPAIRWRIVSFALQRLWQWNIARLALSVLFPPETPRDLILAELQGALMGPFCYKRARDMAADIGRRYPTVPSSVES
jgi:glycosyltransferase involved in cell wall biosynthesis